MIAGGDIAADANACLTALRAGNPVVCGTSRIARGPDGDAVLDAYVEGGGVALDTAAVYQRGESERTVGDWLSRRPDNKLLILTKGGHPDAQWNARLDPASLRSDLESSLRSLKRDRVDIYLVHRDDETLSVEAIIDVLVGFRDAGLARWIGVSNWRTPRLKAALAYEPIDVVSNLFGLGIPAGPPLLPGVITSFDEEGHELLAGTGTPLVAWSAMSSGFFVVPPRQSDLAKACEAEPESVRRRATLRDVAAGYGRDAEAIHMRWLATAAHHLIPLISSSRPMRISALMAEAADATLDPAVADLVWRLETNRSDLLRPLLLPRTLPQW